jgi:hypothetical protein
MPGTVRIQMVVAYDIDIDVWAVDMDVPATEEAVRRDAEGYLTAEKLLNKGHCLTHVMTPVKPDRPQCTASSGDLSCYPAVCGWSSKCSGSRTCCGCPED